ncbi:MAG TPA: OmpA family protein [Stellaceae bacterium]|nr:OmpA family protein [Stellaceae bacterium]
MTSSIARSGLPPSGSRRLRLGKLGNLARRGAPVGCKSGTASLRRKQVFLVLLFAGFSAMPAAAQYSPYAARSTTTSAASVEVDLSVLDEPAPPVKTRGLKLRPPTTTQAQHEPTPPPHDRIVLVKPTGQTAALASNKSRPRSTERSVKVAGLPPHHRHGHAKTQLAERSGTTRQAHGEVRHAAPSVPIEQATATLPKAAPHGAVKGKSIVTPNPDPGATQLAANTPQPGNNPPEKPQDKPQASAPRSTAPAGKAVPVQQAAAPRPAPPAAAPQPQTPPVVAAQGSAPAPQPAPSTTGSAPPPASTTAIPGDQLASLPEPGVSRLLFAAGATDVPDTAKAQLVSLAKDLGGRASLRLQLSAYAGGTPDSASPARRLSLARALAVRSFLVDQGIHSSRIDVRALGNSTASGSGPADRVDIAVIDR